MSPLRTARTTPVLLALSLAAIPALGQEPSLEDILGGFDKPAPEAPAGTGDLDTILEGFEAEVLARTEPVEKPKDRRWHLNGSFAESVVYNYAHDAPAAGETDHRGLSRLRSKLSLELKSELGELVELFASGYTSYDVIYSLKGRDEYTDEVLESLESEAELGESWLRAALNRNLDLTLGRQIVVWGKSDNLRITDVINPLDNREPGMVDIEDLRLPLTMARLDWYAGPWAVTAMAIPELRFDKNPPFGSDFYISPDPPPAEELPEDGGSNTEYAAAAKGFFSGWDLGLYWAQLFSDEPYLDQTGGQPVLRHSRLSTVGAAANLATGPWLLKAEAAHLDGLRFSGIAEVHRRTDVLLGLEYAGFRNTTLSLEVADRHLHDYDDQLAAAGAEEDDWQSAFRYSGDFLHARLKLTGLWVAFGPSADEGGFIRLSADYELADALTVSGGAVDYRRGERVPFDAIGDNDRIFAEVKYSF